MEGKSKRGFGVAVVIVIAVHPDILQHMEYTRETISAPITTYQKANSSPHNLVANGTQRDFLTSLPLLSL